MLFDKKQLIEECTSMLRIITDKNFGINKAYSQFLKNFESTIYYDVTIMFDKNGKVVWKSYDDSTMPNNSDCHIENVDIVFSPGFNYGNIQASIVLWGELLPFGEDGVYSDIFIKFEESNVKKEYNGYHNDSLFIIHNLRELTHFMCTIVKEQWEWRANFDIKYTHTIEELNNYVVEFIDFEIKKYGDLFGELQYNVPILYHRGWAESSHYIRGDFDPTQTDIIINIYRCNIESIETLKATIRHELIHYALLRPSQILCKPPMRCKIEAPHWRF